MEDMEASARSAPRQPESAGSRIAQIEGESDALVRALGLLWRPAQRGGPLTQVIAGGLVALVDLHREQDALRRRRFPR